MAGQPQRILVPPGGLLFEQGQPGSAAYLIVLGRLSLVREQAGVRHTVGEVGAGEMVGETALVDGRPHAVSAMAIEPCECLILTRDDLSDRIEQADPVLRLCVSALLDRQHRSLVAGQVSGIEAMLPGRRPGWADHVAAARGELTFDFELNRAIERQELELYFQPIVGLARRQLVGFEALLRWNHPRHGLIGPGSFIAPAEKSGGILAVTAHLVAEVARQFSILDTAGMANAAAVEPLFVSLNVTGADLRQPAFAASVVSTLVDAELDPGRVRLEVTESVLIEDAEQSRQTLERCRDQGMQIAIDDFGTGYSSLNYLNTLPVSVLKLDRSFAKTLLAEATGRTIVAAILQLGRDLGLSTVAEGIENETEVAILAAMGCGFGQGFLFGEPRSLADTVKLIRAWPAPQSSDGTAPLQARTG